MQQRRFKENATLDQRLTEKAQRLRKEAQGTTSGVMRDELIRQAQQAETASHMLEWLSVSSRPADTYTGGMGRTYRGDDHRDNCRLRD
jgi:hypothetical protein